MLPTVTAETNEEEEFDNTALTAIRTPNAFDYHLNHKSMIVKAGMKDGYF